MSLTPADKQRVYEQNARFTEVPPVPETGHRDEVRELTAEERAVLAAAEHELLDAPRRDAA